MQNQQLILLLSLFSIFLAGQSQTRQSIDMDGYQLHFQPTTAMFPDHWNESPINAETAALAESEINRSKNCLEKAIEKYPKKVISENLDHVYFLGKLDFYDLNYGGTYYGATVYLANKGENEGYTDEWLQQSFHHEFSSILLNNYRNFFNESAWLKCNSPGFEYGSGGANAIAEGKSSSKFDSFFNCKGLLNQYSAADLEEDFNEFSENLFYPHKGFKEVLEKYEAIRKKRLLLIDFYHKIHPSFTQSFFDDILLRASDVSLNQN